MEQTVLTNSQQRALTEIGKSSFAANFYLAGGTSLAILLQPAVQKGIL